MSWRHCSDSGRTVAESAPKVARDLADRLNEVLNRTISDAHLSITDIPGSNATAFLLSRFAGRERIPLEIDGISHMLFVQQILQVVEADEGLRPQTESHVYRLQEGRDRKSWLLRWEYYRSPPKPEFRFPLAHVHAAATLRGPGINLDGLHVPTRRVPLETIIRHLITEWGATPKSEDWESILDESIRDFDERRTGH